MFWGAASLVTGDVFSRTLPATPYILEKYFSLSPDIYICIYIYIYINEQYVITVLSYQGFWLSVRFFEKYRDIPYLHLVISIKYISTDSESN